MNRVPLSELADINPKTPLPRNAECSFIGMEDVSEAGEWITRHTRPTARAAGYTAFRDHDVLFAKITPSMENGKGALVEGLVGGIGFGSTEFHVLRAREGAVDRFVAQWAQSPALRQHAEAFMTGSAGQRRVPAAFFNVFQVAALSTSEQQRIAAILDAVDDAIRSSERLVAKLEQLKRGLLHDLMAFGMEENGELRDPVHSPEQFRVCGSLTIPADWALCELDSVVDPRRPVVYGILMPGYGFPGGVPVVKVKDIKDGQIDEGDLLLTDPRIDAEYRRSRVRDGDLLFSIRGTVGRTAFVPGTLDDANITQDTARIAVTGANPRFVGHYLRTPLPTTFIELHTLGQAVRGINLRDVRRIPLILPSKGEQDALADLFDSHDNRIRVERKWQAKLRAIKRGLMGELLAGCVRVKVSEDAAQ